MSAPSKQTFAENFAEQIIEALKNGTAPWQRPWKAGEYVSLQLDDPTFAQPIRANLFQSADNKSTWGLYWNRPTKRSERD